MTGRSAKLADGEDRVRKRGVVSSRGATWLAWSIWALSVSLIALAGLFDFRIVQVHGPDPYWPHLLLAPLILTYPTVGALIASHRPRNPIGWIYCAGGAFGSLEIFATAYGTYDDFTGWWSYTESAILSFTEWAWYPTLFLGATMVFLLFPDGRLPTPTVLWRPVAWIAIIAAVTSAAGAAFPYLPSVINPLEGNSAVEGDLRRLSVLGYQFLFLSCVASLMSLWVRLYRARGQERQQLKWFAYAAALTAVSVSGRFVLLAVVHRVLFGSDTLIVVSVWSPANILGETFRYLMYVGLLILPISTAISILRYRLYDIDRIINRTLVYGLMTVVVLGAYVLMVGYASALLQTGAGGNLAISVVVTGLVALLFHPLRVRLQRAVNRLMYGQRDEPYAVLSRLGQRLESTFAPDAVILAVAQTLKDALKLPFAGIQLDRGGEYETVATAGDPTERLEYLPLVHGGRTVGRLMLGLRAGDDDFGPSDRRLLRDLAHQIAVAAHAARLTSDLRRSRERVVVAREEERRRLRRDLHDGVGPQLAALMLELETASELVSDDAEASALMTKLSDRTRDIVSDVRHSVYALRPPALDELGLAGALREVAARYGGRGLAVEVEVPDRLPPLPAAVEVASYLIAREAMTNVVRHAGASTCRVRIDLDEEAKTLNVEIVDDGRGIGEDSRAGVGMSSMRERAEELGGTLTVGPGAGGGTLVSASLPCETAYTTDHRKE